MTAPKPESLKKQFSDITLAEAERAIYIDFEGFEKKAPHLIGVLINDTYQSIVLDPELTLAAEAKQLPVMCLKDAMESVLQQSVQEDRHIVGFSYYEKDTVLKYAGIGISHRYRDAHKVAKTWANRLPGGKPENWELVTFLKYIRWPARLPPVRARAARALSVGRPTSTPTSSRRRAEREPNCA